MKLQHDVLCKRRRDVLGLLGATVLPGGLSAVRAADKGDTYPSCILTPAQAEGPYFLPEQPKRSDLRSDLSTGAVSAGIPLVLQLRLSQKDGSICRPLPDAIVDVWHCDAAGAYSAVPGTDVVGKNFLRGFQTSDADGIVTFTSIYPGAYPGRAVHIHFKIRTGAKAGPVHHLTSQLYFDDAITDRVHLHSGYVRSGRRRTRNHEDFLYGKGGPALMLALTRQGGGYAGYFHIGLNMS